MAKKKGGGMFYDNPYNEVGNKNPETPDTNDLYWGGYSEMLSKHLQTHDMEGTPNTHSGDDILGGPTPGEPQAAKK